MQLCINEEVFHSMQAFCVTAVCPVMKKSYRFVLYKHITRFFVSGQKVLPNALRIRKLQHQRHMGKP